MLCVHWLGFVFLTVSTFEMRHVASSVCTGYVSALEVRYTVCCISIGGAVCCVLYQHGRCDILCDVSAWEVRYTV